MLSLLVAVVVVSACSPARSIEVAEYLRLRRETACNRTLTPDDVAAAPADHRDAVLELRGAICGVVSSGASVKFLLVPEQGASLLMEAPAGGDPLVSAAGSQRVRVLARVVEGAVGNVAPLQPIAVASDSEVTAQERVWEQREAARRQALASRSMSAASGRSVRYTAPMPPPPPGQLSELARKYLSPVGQGIYPAYAGFIAGWNPRLPRHQVDQITVSLLYFAERHRVDPRLAVALIIAESGFNPNAKSRAGAQGLGQLMPFNSRAFGLANPYDPMQNVRVSMNILKMKLQMYHESGVPDGQLTAHQVALTLAAYNAGSGAVRKFGGIPPYRETQRYVARIMSLYKRLCGAP
ncbi:MAG: lytic transglycosylase domain-containing protein [Armatimonadetes bacterium]|nr:lytic transglycosylase domain-containing protein [Armatimonadota bacterium]